MSFSFETTLSGRRELEFVREARARGYFIALRYVGVDYVGYESRTGSLKAGITFPMMTCFAGLSEVL